MLVRRKDSDRPMWEGQRERAGVAGEEIRGSGGLDHVVPPNTGKAPAFIPREMGVTGRF